MYTGSLRPLRKQLVIECSINQLGVWQARFSHQLESIELGSTVEAGKSELRSGSENLWGLNDDR